MINKFSPDEFLEIAELNNFRKELKQDGFVTDRINTYKSFGIVENLVNDPNFQYFQITNPSVTGNFQITPGIAYDSLGNTINYNQAGVNIQIPLSGQVYWVKISYTTSPIETGLISIGGSNQGLMSGVSTTFTSSLRGQPNFPSKISFPNSSVYTGQYEVLEVISDSSVLLQGSFPTTQTGLQWSIVGSFTPGINPLPQNQFPFQYDSCLVTLVASTGSMPSLTTGQEFIIGTVSYSGSVLTIQDYRWMFKLTSFDRDLVDSVSTAQNKLVGIQSIKSFTTNQRTFWICSLDWKFNIVTSVLNSANSTISISSGYGGVALNTTAISANDFAGWRHWYADGSYSNIISNTQIGGTIVLVVDSVHLNSGASVCCAPNSEEIEIGLSFQDGSGNTIYTENRFFGIAQQNPTIKIGQDEVLYTNQTIVMTFTLKNHFLRTTFAQPFNSSTYYKESAFNSSGVLVDPTQTRTGSNLILTNTVNPASPNCFVGAIMAWEPVNAGEVTANFDSTGLGFPTSTRFAGWAICNGQNSTSDMVGRVLIGITNTADIPHANPYSPVVDPAISPNIQFSIGSNGGEEFHTMTVPELATHLHTSPAHSHLTTDPGHSHVSTVYNTNTAGIGNNCYSVSAGGSININTSTDTTNVSVNSTIALIDFEGNSKPFPEFMPYWAIVWVKRII